MSHVLLSLVLVLASGPAEQILNLMETGKYSDALRESARAAKTHPKDPEVRNLYGLMLLSTLQNEAAAREFKEAIRLSPEMADAHANLGLALVQLNDEQGAKPHLEKAAKLDPANLDNQRELDELLIRLRIRSGSRTTHASGSAAHDVQQFMQMLESGEMETAFDRYVDQRVLTDFVRQVGGHSLPTDKQKRDILRGFKQGFNGQVLARGGRYEGFEVLPESLAGDTAEVQTYLLVERSMSKADVDRMRRFIDSPELSEFISPDILMVFRGLNQADRDAMFGRQVGLRQNQLLPVRWKMKKDQQGRLLINDAVLGSADLVQISLSDLFRKMDVFMDIGAGGDAPERHSSSYELGRIVGQIVGVIIVILVVLRLARKSKKSGPSSPA